MTHRPPPHVLFSLFALSFGFALTLSGAEPAAKPGYTVVLDVQVNEKGAVEDAKVVSSDDVTVDHILDLIAMDKVRQMKPAVRLKDGQPVKYVMRAPFVFPVEGDEGPDANLAPRPSLKGKSQVEPFYPPDLKAKGITGGAILEFIVDADGGVRYLNLLRASQPEFGGSAMAALKQWHFNPAMKDGMPVSSRWRIAVVFEIDDNLPPWEWRLAPRPSLGSWTVLHHVVPPPAAAPPPAPGTGK